MDGAHLKTHKKPRVLSLAFTQLREFRLMQEPAKGTFYHASHCISQSFFEIRLPRVWNLSLAPRIHISSQQPKTIDQLLVTKRVTRSTNDFLSQSSPADLIIQADHLLFAAPPGSIAPFIDRRYVRQHRDHMSEPNHKDPREQ